MESHWATVWEAIADAVPGAEALGHGERRVTWAEFDDRAARLAAAFEVAGVGPGSKIAQFLYNGPEYIESYYAALKVRAVPVNVNYRYLEEELLYLLEDSESEVLVYHAALADRVAAVRDRAKRVRLFVEVDDGSPAGTVPDAAPYEALLGSFGPAPRRPRHADDVTMLYTGGTTGMPKGVVTRIGPTLDTLLGKVAKGAGHPEVTTPAQLPALASALAAEGRGMVSLPACPLMHGTAQSIAMFPVLLTGGKVTTLVGRRFDPDELWAAVDRHGVRWLVIVGDAFGRPMLQSLDRAAERGVHYGQGLELLASSGALLSEDVRTRLLDHLPQARIVDYVGASEGLMGTAVSVRGAIMPTGRFRPVPGVAVFTEDGKPVEPGSGEAGLIGLTEGVPEGYYKDEAKTAQTLRVVDGVRYSFPGDWGRPEADGTILLLGRGSGCINTGGEKVFPEEVEAVLKRVPGVEDCLVFGVPDERFGQRVAGVASLAEGVVIPAEDVLAAARAALAAYKLPKELVLVDVVPRNPNGKPDYKGARALYERRHPTVDASAPMP